MRILLCKPTNSRIVISRPEVVGAGFGIPIFTTVAEGIGVADSRIQLIAKGVVGIGAGDGSGGIRQGHHVAVGVVLVIGRGGAVLQQGDAVAPGIVGESLAVAQRSGAGIGGQLALGVIAVGSDCTSQVRDAVLACYEYFNTTFLPVSIGKRRLERIQRIYFVLMMSGKRNDQGGMNRPGHLKFRMILKILFRKNRKI